MLTFVLLATICDPRVLWGDAAKSRPSFVPEAAFSNPVKFGLSRDVIADIVADLDRAQETIDAINDSAEYLGMEKSNCSTANPEKFPEPEITGSGEIVQLVAGWNRDRQHVATLACIKDEAGKLIFIMLPFGKIRVGRTTWCTRTLPPTSFEVGQKVLFSGTRDPIDESVIVGNVSLK